MPKKRKPAELVKRAGELSEVKPAAPIIPARVAFVEPEVVGMLRDIKSIVAVELAFMRQQQGTGMPVDSSGQKVRNLAATIETLVKTEKAALDEEDLSKLTDLQMAEKFEAEARRLRTGRGVDDDDLG